MGDRAPLHGLVRAGLGTVAQEYERGRPEYPATAVAATRDVLRLSRASTVLELGAGTGKLSRHLVGSVRQLIALEPLEPMRQVFGRTVAGGAVVGGVAEYIPLRDRCVDAVVTAQAFHWFRPAEAVPEIHRVLRPHGRLALLWTAWDRREPWLDALADAVDRLAGDAPRFFDGRWRHGLGTASRLFAPTTETTFRWTASVAVDDLLNHLRSIDFVAVLDDARRRRLPDTALDLLDRAPGRCPRRHAVPVRYLTHLLWCERRCPRRPSAPPFPAETIGASHATG
jgi:SAM-dependent methyltransferase